MIGFSLSLALKGMHRQRSGHAIRVKAETVSHAESDIKRRGSVKAKWSEKKGATSALAADGHFRNEK